MELFQRQTSNPSNPGELILQDLYNAFSAQLQTRSIYIALAVSLGSLVIIGILFSIVRPHHNEVYAPKAKYADKAHAPPSVGRGFFDWLKPIKAVDEHLLVQKIGLDGTIFLRFTRMLRNMLCVLSIVGCGILIPIHVISTKNGQGSTSSNSNTASGLASMTPGYTFGNALWSHVVVSYCFDAIILVFLWFNFRAVLRIKKLYWQTTEFQGSIHSRSVFLTDLPDSVRSDDGILQILDTVQPINPKPTPSIGRSSKGLPDLIEEHTETVKDLESVLAKYLKNPDKLPSQRPTMKAPKSDQFSNRSGKVDSIDYLTERIKAIEARIYQVRGSIDQRKSKSYGFATFARIEEAHATAYHGRKKTPHRVGIQLAPKPNDLIWKNLSLSRSQIRWKKFINGLVIAFLTVIWIAPNALIAIFLSNLVNLANLWPAFRTSLDAHNYVWSAVQAILPPALLSGVYIVLPIIFRRLAIRAGERTKTSREHNVMHNLYAFFVFNNLVVFSLFSTLAGFISTVVNASHAGINPWTAIVEANLPNAIVVTLCEVSPFWVTWLLQRNLAAAIDLAQMWPLFVHWFNKTFLAPTPRQAIEWTAPTAFDYASYYNYFLFYFTVTLCYATIQPIVLIISCFYFLIDTWFKRYLLLYVYVTKTESGGAFWNLLFNRILVATFIANFVATLVLIGRQMWAMVFAMIPLLVILLAFKIFCARTFERSYTYYALDVNQDGEDMIGGRPEHHKASSKRLRAKFAHPAMYQKLITPMVNAKAKHLLSNIYNGRLDNDTENDYSGIPMSAMAHGNAGKPESADIAGMFEVVADSDLDFYNFKSRAEFAQEHGGGGELYHGSDADTLRSGTPISFMTLDEDAHTLRNMSRPDTGYEKEHVYSRSGTPPSAVSQYLASRGATPPARKPLPTGVIHAPRPQYAPNQPAFRTAQNLNDHVQAQFQYEPPQDNDLDLGLQRPFYQSRQTGSDSNLLDHAQPLAFVQTQDFGETPSQELPSREVYGLDRWRHPTTGGYSNVPVADDEDEEMNYDYFRRA